MSKKYELTEETKKCGEVVLHRIRALTVFKGFVNVVSIGDLGGWVESEENLSQKGNCWIYDEAMVFNNAKVSGDAEVHGNATICDCAKVFGYAYVFEKAKIAGYAQVYDCARVYNTAFIYGNAILCNQCTVFGGALIHDHAIISGRAKVYGNARVFGNAKVEFDAIVYGDADVCGDARVSGYASIYNSKVYDNAVVYGPCELFGRTCIGGDSVVWNNGCVLTIGPIGSRSDYTTFSTTETSINVVCGCFNGTIEEFEIRVKKVHQGNRYEEEYLAAVTLAKIKLLKWRNNDD